MWSIYTPTNSHSHTQMGNPRAREKTTASSDNIHL